MSRFRSPILMTPGPVPVPPEVLKILAEPMVHHRTPAFEGSLVRALSNLSKVFQTRQACFIHASTGTGAMESALVNTLSPRDKVITLSAGRFGERWGEMAQVFGLESVPVKRPWGEPLQVEDLKSALKTHPDAKAVLVTACETSTGVLHPIQELAAVVKETPALFCVDAISALGALPLPMDEWHLDVVVGGSQKAFQLPTGLSVIGLSEKAWRAHETGSIPRFYWDLTAEKKANQKNQTHFSSAASLIRALDWVLEDITNKGLDRHFAIIKSRADRFRAALQTLGIGLFPKAPSPSLTVLAVPEGIDGQKIRAELEKEFGVIIMGGQEQLQGRVLRVGHMGYQKVEDYQELLGGLATLADRHKIPGWQPQELNSALETLTDNWLN